MRVNCYANQLVEGERSVKVMDRFSRENLEMRCWRGINCFVASIDWLQRLIDSISLRFHAFSTERSMQCKFRTIVRWKSNDRSLSTRLCHVVKIKGYIFSKGLRKARDTFTLASQKWENNRKGCSASRRGVISWGNRRDRAALNERKRNLIPRYRHANTMFALASKEITEETKMWNKENDRRTSLVKSLLPSGIPLKKSFRSRLCNLGSSNFLIHILFSLYFPSLLLFVLRSTRIRKRDIISFSPFSWYS